MWIAYAELNRQPGDPRFPLKGYDLLGYWGCASPPSAVTRSLPPHAPWPSGWGRLVCRLNSHSGVLSWSCACLPGNPGGLQSSSDPLVSPQGLGCFCSHFWQAISVSQSHSLLSFSLSFRFNQIARSARLQIRFLIQFLVQIQYWFLI